MLQYLRKVAIILILQWTAFCISIKTVKDPSFDEFKTIKSSGGNTVFIIPHPHGDSAFPTFAPSETDDASGFPTFPPTKTLQPGPTDGVSLKPIVTGTEVNDITVKTHNDDDGDFRFTLRPIATDVRMNDITKSEKTPNADDDDDDDSNKASVADVEMKDITKSEKSPNDDDDDSNKASVADVEMNDMIKSPSSRLSTPEPTRKNFNSANVTHKYDYDIMIKDRNLPKKSKYSSSMGTRIECIQAIQKKIYFVFKDFLRGSTVIGYADPATNENLGDQVYF